MSAPPTSGGAFQRATTVFRSFITADGSSGYPAVAGRYHLYISLACPWACRCYAVLHMKGLQDVIGVTVVKAVFQRTRTTDSHEGWELASKEGEEPGGVAPDPVNGVRFIRDLYDLAGAKEGRFSVPVLWDKEKKTIVNNESSEIIRMFNSAFNQLAKNPGLDLYPEPLRPSIDAINSLVYEAINNGVYRCGFATKQEPYEQAFTELFSALDHCEDILSKQRFLAGSVLTEADVRLFMTLIRFDEVYVVHFKTNKKFIREYPNLFNYTKDVFQTPGVGQGVNMWHIKNHYYRSHGSINPFGIVPMGNPIDYTLPHDRDRFK